MANFVQLNSRVRKNLGRVKQVIDIPNLIEIQKNSYQSFLQQDLTGEKRKNTGLQSIFSSVFPIKDFNETSELVFVSYSLDDCKYDLEECRQRGITYSSSVKVTVQLIIYDVKESGEKIVRDIKEQEVYFGEIPLMTDTGTFLINGSERVLVSQLHRSPGVFFDHDKGKTHPNGKIIYNARLIPYRGSWLDFEFDPKDLIFVRIDRRRKMHVTTLLRALGYSTEAILNYFYKTEEIFLENTGFSKKIDADLLHGQRANQDILIGSDVIVKKNTKYTKSLVSKIKEALIDKVSVQDDDIIGKVCASNVFDLETGEIILGVNEEINKENLLKLRNARIQSFKILFIDGLRTGSYLRDTLLVDKVKSTEEALLEVYKRMRPGDPPVLEVARSFFYNLFFNPERYDLSKVGRLKLNYKFYTLLPEEERPSIDLQILTPQDILETLHHLIDVKNGRGSIDDIDHLGNRRVRAIGELMENQYRIGLIRMERAIKERMTLTQEIDTLMPHDLINSKPVSAVIKEYFGSSQLSQFMDQTNPLAEVTHKRRLSALGPGGLTRERAGFEVRDVHPTHYGRICPIETPEGSNIGLISSLALYARVNEYGFVETAYRVVVNGQVTNSVVWCSALEEENKYIAQASASINETNFLVEPLVSARLNGEYHMVSPDIVQLIDVAPNQMVSVAAALVPFLEHDDANRALMGANMQRQAVPLLRCKAPYVGTGIEKKIAQDSGVCTIAHHDGVVESVSGARIVVRPDSSNITAPDIYPLMKFQRSNQSTCYNQKPIVQIGEKVQAGDLIADGPSCEKGELALGQNVLVAFMPWQGYNYEDSILVSERIAKDDIFTSVHIEEFECIARDTKLGKEDITNDIPNVSEESLGELNESGVIRIGAEVNAGDILVGKVTPKGETQLSPEEKLLRAIFGEKASDVRDTSLRVPPGVSGIVIRTRCFYRKGIEKEVDTQEYDRLKKIRDEELQILHKSFTDQLCQAVIGKTSIEKLVDEQGNTLLQKDKKIDSETLKTIPMKYWSSLSLEGVHGILEKISSFEENWNRKKRFFDLKLESLSKGDELPPGVIKVIKVYIAIKRKLVVGDKMAGRHGNKGVVSRVLAEEDMPHLQDGTPVDIILNPLGVPSRMNVGQILEVHLGWAGFMLGSKLQHMIHQNISIPSIRQEILSIYAGDTGLTELFNRISDTEILNVAQDLKHGIHFASPVFDGAPETSIKQLLSLSSVSTSGQTVLLDGRTGEAFEQEVTVGMMYMLKLHHMVDEKIHARSIGPYSLVTQQPLGGKAQFGGQRLGEMEVWAMEAYGAAYTLQEFLTVKSDDMVGRTRMYESIVKGNLSLDPGFPESFNVLLKELQALCLNIDFM